MKILIVGNRGGTNVGGSFEKAAIAMNHEVSLLETDQAHQGPVWKRQWNWRFRSKRPLRLVPFSRGVVEACRQSRPKCLLVTGTGAVDAESLRQIGELGVCTVNFLTDDPWNPAHRARWFLQALPRYHCVFSARRANLDDLKRLGCARVEYLPFAYDPDWCFPEPGIAEEDDVVFAGAGDQDRVPYIQSLQQAGFRVALYGSFWDRYPATRGQSRGQADPATLRRAIGAGRVALCIVRRANRDGHAMRTFEVPAIRACMLAEDTGEHREIFGAESQNVLYFQTIAEMIQKTRWLLEHPEERRRLADAAHRHIVQGRNTYRDRLERILELVSKS